VIRLQKILILCVLAMLTTIASADSAPKLSLKDLHGQTQKLAARHGKIVVLNFWATWCEPCQDELPRLSRLSQSYAGKNVHSRLYRRREGPREDPAVAATPPRRSRSLDRRGSGYAR
jgi:thiol-disulfide isomerase/thioredoxin